MDFDVHLRNNPIGMISSIQCNNSEQAQRHVFSEIAFFDSLAPARHLN